MGCKWTASFPYGYGNIVLVYLWKGIDELYHELPFIPILIFSFLALYKTCKAIRKSSTEERQQEVGYKSFSDARSPKGLQLSSHLDTHFKSIKKLKV